MTCYSVFCIEQIFYYAIPLRHCMGETKIALSVGTFFPTSSSHNVNFLIHLKIFKSMFAVDVEAPVSYVLHGGCTYELLAVMSWFGWKTLIFIGIYFTLQLRVLAIIFFSSEQVDLFSFFPTILFCSSEDIIAFHVEALINCFIKHVFLLYPIIFLLHYY